MTHVKSASCALAVVAAFTSVTVQAAGAAPAAHSSRLHRTSPRIPFTAAEGTAQDNGSYKITWKAAGVRHVAIRANGRTVASGGSTGSVMVRGLAATADRQWFDLVPDRDKLRLADRLVKLDGTDNFRDAGGYRTADGH